MGGAGWLVGGGGVAGKRGRGDMCEGRGDMCEGRDDLWEG